MAGGVGIWMELVWLALWKVLRKMGCRPFERRRKNAFVWLHGFVTWEDEMKGLGHGRKCVQDRGHKRICTWESFGNPKIKSVSLGVLDAYLSGVQRRTLP